MATKANVDKGLVDRLCAFLEHVGKPERQVAARIGISPQALNHATKGKNYLGLDSLRSLVREYRLNINWLLTGEGVMFVGGPASIAANVGHDVRAWVGEPPGPSFTGMGEVKSEPSAHVRVDLEVLAACMTTVDEVLRDTRKVMAVNKKAEVVAALYDLCLAAGGKALPKDNLVRFMRAASE